MIDLVNVTKTYETGTHALNGIDMHIDDGEFVFLVGPSGSGKSTIIKLLTAELKPTSGSVLVLSLIHIFGEKWPDAATAVAAMLENPVREEPYTFYALKGWNPAYGYSAFVLGTDAQAEMLVRMTQVSLNSAKAYYEEKHDKGTFVKNIITDNILPGDIYIRAKELHFPTELPRAVYLVRQVGRSDVAVVELLQSCLLYTSRQLSLRV